MCAYACPAAAAAHAAAAAAAARGSVVCMAAAGCTQLSRLDDCIAFCLFSRNMGVDYTMLATLGGAQ